MVTPHLTVGMAHYADFDGVYFTIQSMRVTHKEVFRKYPVEFVVINQSVKHPDTEKLHNFIAKVNRGSDNVGARVIDFDEKLGTSPSRDRIFVEARGKYILACDCHILIEAGGLMALMDYYEKHPDTQDILSGPIVWDDFDSWATHYNDQWRSEMWGTWGLAWQCPCGKKGSRFTLFDYRGITHPRVLEDNHQTIEVCKACGKEIPSFPWAGHERQYENSGFIKLGSPGQEPFEIPGQGLGLFSCRRDAWLGFNPDARGFGGEELYIHAKFRAAGHKAICIPDLRWPHRFGRAGGVPYPLTLRNKIRNYVLEFQEMEWDLEPVYEHFVKSGKFSQQDWDALIANSKNIYSASPSVQPVKMDMTQTIESIFQTAVSTKRDLNEHLEVIKALAGQCDHVTEISTRRESLAALAASKAPIIRSYNTEIDGFAPNLIALMQQENIDFKLERTAAPDPSKFEETDLLFIDTRHNFKQFLHELKTYGVKSRRFIIRHDTSIYGEQGDDGGPGLLAAFHAFTNEFKEWKVIYHTQDQFGLTVIGKLPEDMPEHEIHLWDPGYGPGTELQKILASLGIKPNSHCDCNAKARQMNVWGVEGCRQHFEEIAQWMRDNHVRWGWKDHLKAAAKAVTTGLAFKLNPTDPFPGLIEECIKRAEQKE